MNPDYSLNFPALFTLYARIKSCQKLSQGQVTLRLNPQNICSATVAVQQCSVLHESCMNLNPSCKNISIIKTWRKEVRHKSHTCPLDATDVCTYPQPKGYCSSNGTCGCFWDIVLFIIFNNNCNI